MSGVYVLVCSAISFGFWRVGGYGVETDAFASYFPEVRNLLSGQFTALDGYKGPGYHFAVALVSLAARNLFYSAKLVSLASAGVVLTLLFAIVRRHVGAFAAWVAIAILVTNAPFALYTIQIGTDMYFLALAVATSVLILDSQACTNVMRRALVAGALAGLTYLTRYNGVFLIVGGVAVFLLSHDVPAARGSRTRLRAGLQPAGVFLSAAAAVILPWGLFTWSKGQGFFYNRNYQNIAYEMYGRDLVTWDQYWEYFPRAFHSFGDVLSGNFGTFFTMVVRNSVEHIWFDLQRVLAVMDGTWGLGVGTAWGLMIFLGLCAALSRYRLAVWPAALIGLLAYGLLVPVFYGERLSMPMVPVYAILVAVAADWAASRTSWPRVLRYAPTAAAAALICIGATRTLAATEQLLMASPDEVRIIADAVDDLPEEERVLARKPHIAHFLGIGYAGLPIVESLDDLPEIARTRHARYLFVSTVEAQLRPPLAPLLNPWNAPAFLKPIAATRRYPAVLYEFTITIPPLPQEAAGVVPATREPEAPVAVRLGRAYLAAKRDDLALKRFTAALKDNPNEPTALLGMIQIDLAWVGWLDGLLDVDDSPSLSRAARQDRLEALATAEVRIGALATRFPDSREVQLAYAEVLLQRKKRAEAAAAYRRVVDLDHADAKSLAVLADLHRELGENADAAQSYAALLLVRPGDAHALGSLGIVLAAMGRYAEATDYLVTALRIDDSPLEARAALARVYDVTGDTLEARRHWEQVLRWSIYRSPVHVEAARALGLAPKGP